MTTAVLTDSSACLPVELAAQHGIVVIPVAVLIDGKEWPEGVIDGRAFYDRLRRSQRATTAAPAPGQFLEAIRVARDSGAAGVLCLTLSSEYSGTYGAAIRAQEVASGQWPGFPVRVVDTQCIAAAHGFCVLAAARAACGGGTMDDAAEAAGSVAGRAHLVGVLDTTRYLAKSGRLPWFAHWGVSLLRIKPVIAASGGRIRAVGRARTIANGMAMLLRSMAARVEPGAPLHVGVMHADAPERACELAAMVREQYLPAELVVSEVTGAMGVHTGPGFIGLAFYSEEGAA